MIEVLGIIKYEEFQLVEIIRVKPPLEMSVKFDNEACITYFMNADIQSFSPPKTQHRNGDFYVYNKCGTHVTKFFNTHSRKNQWTTVIAIHLYAEVVNHLFEKYPHMFLSGKKETLSQDQLDEAMKIYFHNLLFLANNPTIIEDRLLEVKLLEILILLSKGQSLQSQQEIFNWYFDTEEMDFKKSIEVYQFTDMGLEELAGALNFSLSTFKRKFQSIYHTNPSSYLKEQKLIKASHLLCSTNLTIKEIMFQVGYNNPSHFSKIFKARFQSSPHEFRLNCKRQ